MAERDDDALTDYRALAEFRYQIRRFLRFSEEAARAVGLEPQQYLLLLAVKGFPEARPVTIGDLAERLQLHHNSTVELVNRSVRQGLVMRQHDTTDRRQVTVTLTSHGEDVLARLAWHHERELRTAGPALIRALEALQMTLPFGGETPTHAGGANGNEANRGSAGGNG